MRLIMLELIFVMIVMSGGWSIADQVIKEQAVETKAAVLEQKSAADDKKAPLSSQVIITKPEAQVIDPHGEKKLDDAITCLARTIYWEARGEETAGMEAIANVVMNRLSDKDFPDTICEVVRQGSEQGNCSFSWWCDGHSDAAQEDDSYAIAKEISRKALNRQLPARTEGALYFHHREVSPDWAKVYQRTTEIGDHIFYKPQSSDTK